MMTYGMIGKHLTGKIFQTVKDNATCDFFSIFLTSKICWEMVFSAYRLQSCILVKNSNQEQGTSFYGTEVLELHFKGKRKENLS